MAEEKYLTAAACAARTGLTIRALRVYERYGLIKPQRSANGWRRYGAEDLARLNTITVLKAAGFTLARIRAVIRAKKPSLQHALEMQIEAWTARKAEAERGQALAQAALRRVLSDDRLSIDELCNLIRSIEMSNLHPAIQKVIDQQVSPAQQHEWLGWWQQHPQILKSFKDYAAAQQVQIFEPLRALFEQQTAADSPRVQALIERNNELLLEFNYREAALQVQSWNPNLTRQWLGVGRAAMSQAKQQTSDPGEPGMLPQRELMQYFFEAVRRSAHYRAITEIFGEFKGLHGMAVDPGSPDAQRLADRFRTLCSQHRLGDPWTFARWATFHSLAGESSEIGAAVWTFVQLALRGPQATPA